MSYQQTFQLPGRLTNGNDGRGNKWFSSAKVRKKIEDDLRRAGMARSEPYRFPVKCTWVRILGKGERLWDSSSVLRGNVKEYEDALVAVGWFVDDSPRYITMTFGAQDGCRRNGSCRIELVIEQDGPTFSRGPSGEGSLFG